VIFHRSANRAHLLLGCDRELALSAVFICALVAFSLMSIWGVFVAGLLWSLYGRSFENGKGRPHDAPGVSSPREIPAVLRSKEFAECNGGHDPVAMEMRF